MDPKRIQPSPGALRPLGHDGHLGSPGGFVTSIYGSLEVSRPFRYPPVN